MQIIINIDNKIIDNIKKFFSKGVAIFLGIPLICFATVLSIQAVGDKELVIFQPGNPIQAEEINQNFELLEEAVHLVVPAGTVISYAGNTIPDGWLKCDGASVSKIQFPRLFDAIGYSWGGEEGDSDFILPDLRGRFLRGLDYDADHDEEGREKIDPDMEDRSIGSYQNDEIKNHEHNDFYFKYYNNKWKGGGGASGGYTGFWEKNPNPNSYGGNETRPTNAAVNYIIKY